MNIQSWTLIFVGISFSVYLSIAWFSRVRDTKGFYVAGRGVPAIANGMATAADWMSAASYISMAGLISMMGYTGGVYLMGWTGGYVLLALLIAPYLRKFGHFTVPDFIGDRYNSNVARLVAVVCAIFVSFTYVAGQMRGVGVVFSRFLEVDVNVGVIIGMVIVFIYATLGGMKGITWTQVAQYWVLITAFLIPAIAISIKLTGHPIPQIGLGSTLEPEIAGTHGIALLEKLNQIQVDLGFDRYTDTFVGSWNKVNVFCVVLALMAGTAGLPHVIVRFYTVKSVKAARWSAFWALLFISMLYLTAPATAAFARYYMIQSLNGKTVEQLPDWFQNWEKTGLILWMDDGDGMVRYCAGVDNEIFRNGKLTTNDLIVINRSHQKWIDTGGTEGNDGRIVMRQKGLSGPDRDIIVLATPEMAELADWIIALVAAGGLAAALSTASGLLLVISASISHDLYYRVINPKATEKQRLLLGRTVIGFAVVVAGLLGIYPPGFVSQVVAFAFGLAAASFFPTIVLGIFNKRVGTVPAVCGMLVGIVFTAYYIITCVFFEMDPWTFGIFEIGINPQGIGTVGMLLNFVITLILTLFFRAPGKKVQNMVDLVREPEGVGPAIEIETAPEH
ncbi:MAG: cation acetate symporter [Candidatus Scalindua sp.]|nr:cation acetate symporter [Candidatus Scalindua sp.]MBT5307446.1 cation acetate symporter [Candidatus Scalindua sp.]MBT6225765.1 cation acetate symporter [Candidatus Scalindua sp.]MBT6561595.1 cation acetate symporter [Candidatus Scalindua sp.]MBT7212210.1 cation acetate symporter [Candidatus Scalindua sp.]